MSRVLEAKCHCGSVHFKLTIPESQLPLKAYMCHCSICRYGTGAPATFHTPPPDGVVPEWIAPSSDANTTYYGIADRVYGHKFCSTCGCHVGCTGDDGSWTPSTGVFKDVPAGTIQWSQHVYSHSAVDRGLANMLTHIGGNELRDWNPPADDPTANVVRSEAEVGEDGKERLRAQCLCGGVSFTIKRPTEEILAHGNMRNYVSPLDKTKWMALWDVCNDCRLVDGSPVIGWTFVPRSCIEPPIGDDLEFGTLKTYVSSKDVLRAFCGTCSATVFYTHTSRKFGDDFVLDIATGILRAPEGSLAENWLTWRGRLANVDGGLEYDKEWTAGLAEGMEKWSMEKYGQLLTMEI